MRYVEKGKQGEKKSTKMDGSTQLFFFLRWLYMAVLAVNLKWERQRRDTRNYNKPCITNKVQIYE